MARDAKYGDAINVLTSIFGCEINEVIQPDGIFEIGAQYDRRSARGISDVKYNQDGKISEIMYNGQRYMLRYDTNGNLSKAIVQGTDDNGTVRMQTVTTIKPDGSKVLQNYTYDENGVENTSDSQKAINKVVELYTTEKRDISKSQNTYNKFKAFIENDTMAKLKAAGVSNESIQALLDNLFGEIIFEDNDYNKALADVYKEQYEKLFHETPQILMKVEGFPSIIK